MGGWEPPRFELKHALARATSDCRYFLSDSACEPLDLGALAEGSQDEFLGLSGGYPEIHGSLALRGAIARAHAPELCGDQEVVVSDGADGALTTVLIALSDSVSRVIVATPYYPAVAGLARIAGLRPQPWRIDQGGGPCSDLNKLERILRGPERAVVVVGNPQNPTGRTITADQLATMAAVVDRSGGWLLVDEVQRGLETEATQAAAVVSEHSISIGSLSKSYGLGGLRVGWILCRDRNLIARCRAVQDHTHTYIPVASAWLACRALERSPELLATNRALARQLGDELDAFVRERSDAFAWTRPDGGCLGWIECLGEPALALAERARHEQRLLLLPAPMFDGGDRHIRVGFGRSRMRDGLRALGELV